MSFGEAHGEREASDPSHHPLWVMTGVSDEDLLVR
jgi:hypothetical protein